MIRVLMPEGVKKVAISGENYRAEALSFLNDRGIVRTRQPNLPQIINCVSHACKNSHCCLRKVLIQQEIHATAS